MNGNIDPKRQKANTSELSKIISSKMFETVYTKFVEQADKNMLSKKAQGSKIPYGFTDKVLCDGASFSVRYGTGAASATPYVNWWVVSIYYLPKTGRILLGIEEDRYAHIREISVKPLRYEQIGKKTVQIAVYYSTTKDSVNYPELYEKFIEVCDEVRRLGLD